MTFNAARPATKLCALPLLVDLTKAREKLESDDAWRVRTWVVMPDHMHALIQLGEAASLSNCIRLFKGRLSSALRRDGVAWQDGYYEHQMRSYEDRLPVFLYIFLNPYRAQLLSPLEKWPGYYCAPEDWAWFESLTNSETPFPEWLR